MKFLFCQTLATIITLLLYNFAKGELVYNSAEGSSRWSLVKKQILHLLDERIRIEESKLTKLHNLQETFLRTLQSHHRYLNDQEIVETESNHSLNLLQIVEESAHPIEAFVTLRRLLKAIEETELFFQQDDEKKDSSDQCQEPSPYTNLKYEFDQLGAEYGLPSPDDLVDCGEALLRLQAFYELDIDSLVKGRLVHNPKDPNQDFSEIKQRKVDGPHMDSEDCFELGKIAYEGDYYSLSVEWFQKALELIEEEKQDGKSLPEADGQERINDILEYMAFAAWKSGQLKYAAQLTEFWLDKDPENERARDNLEYYREELEQEESFENSIRGLLDTSERTTTAPANKSLIATVGQLTAVNNTYPSGAKFNAADYEVAEDRVVQNLCKRSTGIVVDADRNSCTRKVALSVHHISPEIKIETLYSSPNIIRIYDIITENEAEHLRRLALPKLQRSTVQTRSGLVTSEFRIAKTAWLSRQSDPIVDRIEQRISEILNLDLKSSEDLQVVNYGLGGFYGPHLDSARDSNNAYSENNESLPISQLFSNDRLATILIYLNRVGAGGSTVFPKLGLTVTPIERSAVVWYNILKNGFTDERTLHTGCPVLLGSKWIATKWPREKANSFLRPCSLNRYD